MRPFPSRHTSISPSVRVRPCVSASVVRYWRSVNTALLIAYLVAEDEAEDTGEQDADRRLDDVEHVYQRGYAAELPAMFFRLIQKACR